MRTAQAFISTLFLAFAVFLIALPACLAEDQILQLAPAKTMEGATSLNAHLESIRSDKAAAYKAVRNHWLEKAAEANPAIIAAITTHRGPSTNLAHHPCLGNIAQSDHYLCRRLTKWKQAARSLARNPEAYKVIALDPQGIYDAIKRDKRIARILAKNPNFAEMIIDNPDLGTYISSAI
jgi:hypothetical protein